MLIDELKKANIQAMKDKDAVLRAIYSIVINKYMNLTIELKASGRVPTDAALESIIQKTCKELDDEAAGYEKVGNTEKYAEIVKQKAAIQAFLPKQLTEDEIRAIIATMPDATMPTIMGHFKNAYAGKVDMGLVAKIARGA